MVAVPPIAFIHIEKAAGITINRILRRSFGVRHCDVEPWSAHSDYFSAEDMARLKKLYPSLKSIAGHRVKPYSDLGNTVRYFTFIREPVARCASHYQFQVQVMRKHITFEEWISDKTYHNFQTRKLAGNANFQAAITLIRQLPIFVGLIEAFDESIVMLQKQLGEGQLNLTYRKENVAKDSSIKDELLQSPKTRVELERANEVDIKVYQYVKESLYPEQKNQYGGHLEADVSAFRLANKPAKYSFRYALGLAKRNLLYKPALRLFRR